MRKLLPAVLLAVVFVGAWAYSEEQFDTTELGSLVGQPIRIETEGRGSFQGVLFKVSDDRVEIEGADGEITQVSLRTITGYEIVDAGKKGRSYYQDSASNRLLVMPTGFAMEPGELHVADQEIVVVTASYGLNDYMSFWAGITPAGGVLSARFILPLSETFAVSTGGLGILEWLGATDYPVSGMLLPYGLFSYGKSNNNVTVGGGAAYFLSKGHGIKTAGYVAVLGGKLVMSATTALVTENWVIWTPGMDIVTLDTKWDALPFLAVPGLVFRIAGMRFSWDIGAVMPLQPYYLNGKPMIGGMGGQGAPWIPLPWISITYRIR